MQEQAMLQIRDQNLSVKISRLRRIGPASHLELVKTERELQAVRSERAALAASHKFEEIRKSRIRIDPVLALFRGGEIDQEQFTAAEQICDVWEAISKGRNLQAGNMEPTIRADRQYEAPLEKLPFAVDAIYRRRWIPWANVMSKSFISVGSNRRLRIVRSLDVMIDIAAERKTLSETVLKIGMRKSEGLERLKIIIFRGLNAWVALR